MKIHEYFAKIRLIIEQEKIESLALTEELASLEFDVYRLFTKAQNALDALEEVTETIL